MSKVSELLIKIINSETCEVGKDHCFPDEPLIHNRPCHRCSSKDDCFVIESIDALDELEKKPETKCKTCRDIGYVGPYKLGYAAELCPDCNKPKGNSQC